MNGEIRGKQDASQVELRKQALRILARIIGRWHLEWGGTDGSPRPVNEKRLSGLPCEHQNPGSGDHDTNSRKRLAEATEKGDES